MDPDKYQQAWQATSSQTQIKVDADLLLKEVRRNQRDFRVLVLQRDSAEIGVSLLLLGAWLYMGITTSSPWTWYLMVPVTGWIVGFILLARARRPRTTPDASEPLLRCVRESLAEVEHRIWLQRNVFWWFILPTTVPVLAFLVHLSWLKATSWFDALTDVNAAMLAVFLGLLYFLYHVTLRSGCTQYEPRREELLALLASLGDESSGKFAAKIDVETAESSRRLRWWIILASVTTLVLVLALLAAGFLGSNRDSFGEYPKKSPFAAIRWQEAEPEVEIGEEWLQLVSLNDLSTKEILAFSRKTYGNLWRKRFEEDLVELLTRMGHPPKDTVKLVVRSLTSSETRVLPDVPMTTANRWAIKTAAEK